MTIRHAKDPNQIIGGRARAIQPARARGLLSQFLEPGIPAGPFVKLLSTNLVPSDMGSQDQHRGASSDREDQKTQLDDPVPAAKRLTANLRHLDNQSLEPVHDSSDCAVRTPSGVSCLPWSQGAPGGALEDLAVKVAVHRISDVQQAHKAFDADQVDRVQQVIPCEIASDAPAQECGRKLAVSVAGRGNGRDLTGGTVLAA